MDLIMRARRELARIQTGHEPVDREFDLPDLGFSLDHYPDAFANNLDHVTARRREWEETRRVVVQEDEEYERWKAVYLSTPAPEEQWLTTDEGKMYVAYRDSEAFKRANARARKARRYWDFTDDLSDYGSTHLNTAKPGFVIRDGARTSVFALNNYDCSSVHAEFTTVTRAQAFLDAVEEELTINPAPEESGTLCVHWAFGDRAPGDPWVIVIQRARNMGDAQLADIEERKRLMRFPEEE